MAVEGDKMLPAIFKNFRNQKTVCELQPTVCDLTPQIAKVLDVEEHEIDMSAGYGLLPAIPPANVIQKALETVPLSYELLSFVLNELIKLESSQAEFEVPRAIMGNQVEALEIDLKEKGYSCISISLREHAGVYKVRFRTKELF